jgi:hypothetical protein
MGGPATAGVAVTTSIADATDVYAKTRAWERKNTEGILSLLMVEY